MKRNSQKNLVTKVFWFLAVLFLMVFNIPQVKAQTDTEFWFVAPEINLSHYAPGGANAFLKLSTGNLPATVTISMPAGDPIVFPDIVVNIPAFGFQVVDLTCWVVSPCVGIDINTSYPEANYFDVNLLENKPLNASGINNFGLRITSTTPITAYYEISRQNNKDIWTLKGRNGLGTEFYTPFQTNRENWTGGNVKAYSAIDVVATEDGTEIQFSLPPGISASYGAPANTIPGGGTFTRKLNRGQTFSLFPRWRTDQTPQRPSQLAADRLRGVRIVSTNGNPIAVNVKDDSFYHTGGGCYDMAGDQLVPTDIIGREYAVIRTDLYSPTSPRSNEHDHIYILATQNATVVDVFKTDGSLEGTYNLNAGQQEYIRLPAPEVYYRIVSNNPVYVWHIAGFGCEQGGAILPPIDKCTGVPRVAFARTNNETFYIIMMVRKGAETNFLFDGVARDDLFPPATFVEIPGSDWSVARFGPFIPVQIAVGTHHMQNTEDVFHLGVVNGGASSGCFYGYFSDYNEFNPSTLVVETGTSGGRVCVGETLQLYASGGTQYLWTPDTYLDDPTSATPQAINITSSIIYTVTVTGVCNLSQDLHVNIQAAGPVDAFFEPDVIEGYAEPANPSDIPTYTFTFNSTSDGDYSREWRWRLLPTGEPVTFASGDNDSSDPVNTVSLTLPNSTNQILDYQITLICGSYPPFCFKEHTEVVRVHPVQDIILYNLEILVNPQGSGMATGEGEYYEGYEVNLTANPNEGYEFVNWTINGDEVSVETTFIYSMPAQDVTVNANLRLITYTISFNIFDAIGNALSDAIITLNGVEYEPGHYHFNNLLPSTYSYSISFGCAPDEQGQIAIIDSDVIKDVILQTLLGDANGDLSVNITDVVVIVGYILETYPGNFCFYNADVIADKTINIQDVVATANIILSEKFQTFSFVKSQEADIYLSSDGISLKSDGTIAGLQLVITGLEQEVQLNNLLPSHQLAYRQNGDKALILIFSTENTPIAAGEIDLISFSNGDVTAKWGDAIAVNTNANLVPIQKHTGGLTTIQSLANSINLMIYPNPASENLNVAFANESPKPVNVSIISIHGQKIKEKQVSQKGPALLTFDITKMPTGAYLVRIEYNDQMLTRVIMVK